MKYLYHKTRKLSLTIFETPDKFKIFDFIILFLPTNAVILHATMHAYATQMLTCIINESSCYHKNKIMKKYSTPTV